MGQQFLAQLRAHVSTNLCWCSHMGPYGLALGGVGIYSLIFYFFRVYYHRNYIFLNYFNVFNLSKGI